jgi:tetraprenyl-beta-curcumene synthase
VPAQEVAGDAAGFVNAALRYWLLVFPCVTYELRRLSRLAGQIAEPEARRFALAALEKRSNLEGAAAFATFVHWRQRGRSIRALVNFQAAYNYLDLLAEQPSPDPVARARQLHEALCAALDPTAAAKLSDIDLHDDGLLAELVERCRSSFSALPASVAAAPAARKAALRIVEYQSLSLGEDGALARWAAAKVPPGSELAWWEIAGAAGSSLAVHALIAAAASASLDAERVVAIERAYHPWAGALHSLLDSLVDEAEDAAGAQLSLIACYPSTLLAAERMRRLAAGARDATRGLHDARSHRLLLTAMACSYISTRADSEHAQMVSRELRGALGWMAVVMSCVFRVRAHVTGITAFRRDHGAVESVAGITCMVGERERGADAGAA